MFLQSGTFAQAARALHPESNILGFWFANMHSILKAGTCVGPPRKQASVDTLLGNHTFFSMNQARLYFAGRERRNVKAETVELGWSNCKWLM